MFDISLFLQKRSTQTDITPKPIALSNCNTVYTTGNSDHIFYLNIGMNDKCIGIFDGNGESSKDFARIAGNFFMESLQDEWGKIKQYILDNNEDKISSILKSIFDTTDEYLDIKLSNEYGGTTALILGLFYINDKIYSFTANIGNTACVLYSDNKTTHLWENHSADNILEWDRYCKKTSASKRKQFVYNRINVFDNLGNPLGPVITNTKFNKRPIPIFDYKNRTAAVIMENIDLLRETDIPLGGNETVRRHLITKDDGITIVDPVHAHENTGATVDGKIKLTRTLGNFKIRAQCYLDAEPSIFLNTIENDSVIVMGSDGFFNLWRYEDIREHLVDKTLNSSNYVQALYNKTLETATKENYKLIHNRYPIWDDITFAVIKINNRNRPVVTEINDTAIPNVPKIIIPDEPQISTRTNIIGRLITKDTSKPNKPKKKKNCVIRTEGRRRRKRRKIFRNTKGKLRYRK
jgi:serine/threonine protein phosphatase PrpC